MTMSKHCNYLQALKRNSVDPTPLREAVLRSIAEQTRPLAATEIMAAVQIRTSINKVTLYRILDLFVDKGLVKRLSAGDRAFRYGMGETHHHQDHAHFVCTRCGVMECLEPELFHMDVKKLHIKGKRIINHVDVRFEGICESCREETS